MLEGNYCLCSGSTKFSATLVLKEYFNFLGNMVYLLPCQEIDEKIDTTFCTCLYYKYESSHITAAKKGNKCLFAKIKQL